MRLFAGIVKHYFNLSMAAFMPCSVTASGALK